MKDDLQGSVYCMIPLNTENKKSFVCLRVSVNTHKRTGRIHSEQLILGGTGENFTFSLRTSVFEVLYDYLDIVGF